MAIIISNGLIRDAPLPSGQQWTLGNYVDEFGGVQVLLVQVTFKGQSLTENDLFGISFTELSCLLCVPTLGWLFGLRSSACFS